MKLKGIMETSLGGFLTFRGFADFEEIARISKSDEGYQRNMIEQHSKDLQGFLERGENLFFPELVLGCCLPEDEEEIIRLGKFYRAFQDNQKGNFGFKKLNIGIQTPKPYGDSTFKVATLSTLKERSDENVFFRIDGNHRIAAFENLKSKTKNLKLVVAVCIIFFRTKEEYSKQAKMIFHNLNFKIIPLSKEQNLRLIFEDEENFNDETLKNDKSFGMPYYYYAKEASKCSFEAYFTNLEGLFEYNNRSSFLEFFKFLESKGKEIVLETIKANLSSVNTIFENENLNTSKNINLFLAFLYYQIYDRNTKKIELFTKWVLKNHIYKSKIDMESLINIFDEIYESRIKEVFIAMPFNERTSDNVWDCIVEVYNELIEEGYGLSQQHKKEDKYVPHRVDVDNVESKDIIEKIKKGIKECDLVMADLTYNNQNVYYEVGLAQGQDKPLILLFDKEATKEKREVDKPTFDLCTMEHVEYDSNYLNDLKNKLKEKLKNILDNICGTIC